MKKINLYNSILLLLCIFLLVGCTQKDTNTNEIVDVTETETQNTPEDLPFEINATNAVQENSIMYKINNEESIINWSGSAVVGKEHNGTLAISEGSVKISNNDFEEGSFIIDMESMTADNDKLLDHLKNEDFFEVETHPTATINITNIEETVTTKTDNKYNVTGNLTIKGITNLIEFPAIIIKEENRYQVSAQFTIDRTKWDITFKSGSIFSELGDSAIKDEMNLDLQMIVEAI